MFAGISVRAMPCIKRVKYHWIFRIFHIVLYEMFTLSAFKHAPSHDAVFQYLDKKRGEGKNYYVYMMAGANKFLRIYYARVKEHLGSLAVQ